MLTPCAEEPVQQLPRIPARLDNARSARAPARRWPEPRRRRPARVSARINRLARPCTAARFSCADDVHPPEQPMHEDLRDASRAPPPVTNAIRTVPMTE